MLGKFLPLRYGDFRPGAEAELAAKCQSLPGRRALTVVRVCSNTLNKFLEV
jgi:hypothetical protein